VAVGDPDRDDGTADVAASDEQLLTLLHGRRQGRCDRSAARDQHPHRQSTGAELMEVLQARTRFQAGIQAARRGWIE